MFCATRANSATIWSVFHILAYVVAVSRSSSSETPRAAVTSKYVSMVSVAFASSRGHPSASIFDARSSIQSWCWSSSKVSRASRASLTFPCSCCIAASATHGSQPSFTSSSSAAIGACLAATEDCPKAPAKKAAASTRGSTQCISRFTKKSKLFGCVREAYHLVRDGVRKKQPG
eukprot:scaffold6253_cov162-Pinguiococcus_pyrenoidosus.AAC.1